jgi:hypothetical protein
MPPSLNSAPGRLLLPPALLAAAVAAAGAEVGSPVDRTLRVRGRIESVAPLDLDGDSLDDLLVFSVTGKGHAARRWISAFWQGSGGTFAARPDVVWEPEPPVAALDPFPPGGAGGEEALWSLRADGVFRQRFRRGAATVEAQPVLKAAFDHLVAEDGAIAWLDFVAPWGGSEADLLVPAFPYPRFYRDRGGSYGPGLPLELPPVSGYRASGEGIEIRYRFASPALLDGEGAARRLVFFRDDEVRVFDPWSARGDGLVPAERRSRVQILDEEEAAAERSTVRTRLADVDGDGRPDLVATVFRDSGLLRFTGRILIFRGRPDGTLPEQADETLEVEDGMYDLARALDLDGDGRREIVVPAVRLGIWGSVRVLTTRRVAFHLETLEPDAGNRYDPRRASRDGFTFKLSPSFDLPVNSFDDLDGDGRLDFVIGRSEGEVCAFLGKAPDDGHRFQPRPAVCLAVDPFSTFRFPDLDGDGRAEVVRYRTRGDEDRGEVTVTFLRP